MATPKFQNPAGRAYRLPKPKNKTRSKSQCPNPNRLPQKKKQTEGIARKMGLSTVMELRQYFNEEGRRRRGYLVMAIDGSSGEIPNSKKNQMQPKTFILGLS
jgi:hypothetical protein